MVVAVERFLSRIEGLLRPVRLPGLGAAPSTEGGGGNGIGAGSSTTLIDGGLIEIETETACPMTGTGIAGTDTITEEKKTDLNKGVFFFCCCTSKLCKHE